MLGRTVAELESTMSSAELAEWLALLRVEPWGPYRADLQAAIGAWASAAPWSSKVKLADFLPEFGARDKSTDQAAMVAKMLALGGKVTDGQP